MSTAIESTNIPALALKALQKNNIKTVEELLALSSLDTSSVKAFSDMESLNAYVSKHLKLKGVGAERLSVITDWLFSQFCGASEDTTTAEAPVEQEPTVSEAPTPEAPSAPKVLWIKTLPIKGAAPQYIYFTELANLISNALREGGATIISDEAICNVFEENPWPTEYPIYVCTLALAAFPLSVVAATLKADVVYLGS